MHTATGTASSSPRTPNSIAPQVNPAMITTGCSRVTEPSTSGPTRLSTESRSAMTKPTSRMAACRLAYCTATSPTSVAEVSGPITGTSSNTPTVIASRTAFDRWNTKPKPIQATMLA